MTRRTPSVEPWPYRCRDGQHKVITADHICVICGGKGVTDARITHPATPESSTP